ncbi:glycosyltransferase [Rhizobium sp. AQ_MP]|jgi:glycosyltransferase involved in cell wall biosynthesis|uniref:glycosyltransferase family 2 protein n=1 Tax=Rhizobium sp. AQ_MP TaxID=2761536 RepID=UPI001639A3E2|nr:glycosyltransferase [Rhizobium sp. AQ_MP]MBC2774689.1 glycosyltransferase [Rhizobium sp. AQ_MP]
MTQPVTRTAGHPLVSVCIPSYNHEKYIGACIESILRQTVSDFEIVITDDCSNDGSVALIRSIDDPRIRLFESAVNQGPAVAANNNILNARGEYLCLLASDDLFHPKKIEKQLAYLTANPEVAAAFSYMRYVDEAGQELPDHPGYSWIEVDNQPREVWLRRFFEKGNLLSAPTVMIRRSVLDKVGFFDPRFLQTQDFDLWIRVCLQSEIHVLPERLVDYRVRDYELNTSAATPMQQSQVYWELAKNFEAYASIEDPAFFHRIFPEAEAPCYTRWPLKAVLADIASQQTAPYLKAFGLELMYQVLSDEAQAQKLAEEGFAYPQFFKMMGAADVFGLIARVEAERRLAAAEQRIGELEKKRLDAERHLAAADQRVGELAGEVAFWMERCNRTLDIRARSWIRRILGRA